jgi:hypothetical protein
MSLLRRQEQQQNSKLNYSTDRFATYFIQDPFKNHSHLYHQRSIQESFKKIRAKKKNHSKSKHGCFFRVIRDLIKKKEQRGEVRFWGWSSDLGPDPEIDECTGFRLPRSEMEAGRRSEASSWNSVLGSPPRSGLLADEAVGALLLNEEPVL